jgi:hypothetical protein
VWKIFLYVIISKSWVLIWNIREIRIILGPPSSQPVLLHQYLSSLDRLDYTLSLLSTLSELSAVIALFLMRKIAPYLFMAAVVLGALAAWRFLTPLASLGMGGGYYVIVFSACFGIAIVAGMCLYSWRLLQRGVLT